MRQREKGEKKTLNAFGKQLGLQGAGVARLHDLQGAPFYAPSPVKVAFSALAFFERQSPMKGLILYLIFLALTSGCLNGTHGEECAVNVEPVEDLQEPVVSGDDMAEAAPSLLEKLPAEGAVDVDCRDHLRLSNLAKDGAGQCDWLYFEHNASYRVETC